MPKVKATANAKSTETAKGQNAAEKAARLKLIESQSAIAVKPFMASREAAKKADDSYFTCLETMRGIVTKHSFTQAETQKLLTTVLAKVYCEGDEAEVTMEGNSTAYTLRSKFVRLLHPVDAKAQKEVDKAIAKGVTFNKLLDIARGKVKANETSAKTSQGGARKKGGNEIEDADAFGDLASALVKRAWSGEGVEGFDGGLTLDEIEEAFGEVLAGYRAKLEGGEEEAETEAED